MNEEFDRNEFEREERAFTDAFRDALEGESFRPLDPASITANAPRGNRPWGRVLAAAAAVVVVGLGAGVVVPQLLRPPVATTAAGSAASAPEGASGMEAPADQASSVAAPVPSPIRQANFAVQDWVKVPASPLSARIMASSGWADGRFYFFGGRVLKPGCTRADTYCGQDANTLRDGASYDPVTRTWQLLPSAPFVVAPTPPVVVGSTLYFSSEAGSGSGTTLAAFDTKTSTWLYVPSPAENGYLLAAGDALVNLGTDNGSPAVDESYDPATHTWSALPQDALDQHNEARAGAWVEGKILVTARTEAAVPGTGEYTQLEEYDVATRRWTRLATSKIVTTYPRVVGDQLLVGGPGTVEGDDGTVYSLGARYDVTSGTWSSWRAIPSRRSVSQSWDTVAGDLLVSHGCLYDPATDQWQQLVLPGSRALAVPAIAGSPDGILLFGGEDHDRLSGDAYYLSLR